MQAPDGSTLYSRAGAFNKNGEGMLVTIDGYTVLPQITIPENTTEIEIGQNGSVNVRIGNDTEFTNVGQLQLATFINPAGLQAIGENLYLQSGASGDPQEGDPANNGLGTIMQGYLETSNVNVVEEMVDMIETQRAYELNSKVISTTDQMMQNLNQQL